VSRRLQRWLLGVIALCVAAAHIWLIWMAPTALSFSVRHVHTDNAVILLMAKHMLDKGEFPVFYYGQNWFGSLSAMIHAAVYLVLGGIPPWSIHVAPLLFFGGFCLVLYALARDTLGPAVGVLALGWNIATPVRLSEYTVLPHGGYIEGLMLGTLLLWISVRLVGAEEPWRKNGYYALLGFVGGVAWWTSPLVIYQILASAVYVTMRERLTALLKGSLLSMPAFFLGAAPFLYFYAVDPYSNIFATGGNLSLGHIPGGLYLLLFQRLPDYLDWDLFRQRLPLAQWLAAAVYGAATVFLLWRLRKSFSARHPLMRAAIFPIFFLVFTLLFAASVHARRDSPQYAVPLSAFFPVAIGFWLVHSGRFSRVVVWPACAAMLLLHAWTTAAWVTDNAPRAEEITREYLSLLRDLEGTGARRVYVSYGPGSEMFNFYGRERMLFSEMTGERYAPYFAALEKDPQPAFLYPERADPLTPTLKVIGGTAERERVGDFDLVRRVRATGHRYRQIPPASFHVSGSQESQDMDRVRDRDMDTAWTSDHARKDGVWVTFDLGHPRRVGRIRLWNPGQYHGYYSMDFQMETSVDGHLWHEAIPRSPVHYFYWSGPRVYPWEWGYRWEASFGPVDARLIRITNREAHARFPWMIDEAYLYEDVGVEAPHPSDEQAVLERVRALGLTRVYADRWMSARIAEYSGGEIKTISPFTSAIPVFYVRRESRIIQWDAGTGFVLEDSDADEFERVMREEDIHLSREDFGRWILFHARASDASLENVRGDPGWWWMGLGAVRTDPKGRSGHLAALARQKYDDGRFERALDLSRRAVRIYAFNPDARRVVVKALEKLGRGEEAARESRELSELVEPRVKTNAEFRHTLQLLGYTLSDEHPTAGQAIKVRYFWKVKRDPGPQGRIGIFVHVDNGDRRFQGDHHFMHASGQPIWPVLDDEVLVQDEWIRVPKDAAAGAYQMFLGVYDLPTGKRWTVSAGASAAHNDRVLIGTLQVEAGEAHERAS